MRRLIVHADDFGLTERVNEGIVRAFRDGIVTSTSVMANGQAFEHAVELYRHSPGLDLGVHLTLVEETPVSPAERVPTLLGETDRFVDNAVTFSRRLLFGKINLGEVRDELDAQIAKVVDSGLHVSHLDSHQHVHVLPGVCDIVIALAKRYGIKVIRLPREPLRGYMLTQPAKLARLSQLVVLNALCRLSSARNLKCADTFIGFFYGGQLSKTRLCDLVARLPNNQTCELMCHPGAADSTCQYSHWHYNHVEELEALCDPEVYAQLQRNNVELISYNEFTYLV